MKDSISTAEYHQLINGGKKKSKYGNVRTEYNGKKYDSKREAEYAAELDLRLKAKDIVKYFEQVPFELEGGKYIADFVVLHKTGKYEVIDVKGVKTQVYRLKKRQMKERWNIDIVEV